MLHVNLTNGTSLFSLDLEEAASFDREGRLLYYFRGDETFKRSLASSLYRRTRHEGRRWEPLDESRRLELFGRAYAVAARARGEAQGEAARRLEDEVLRWSPAALLDERSRFDAVYQPVSILPPDCYQTIVVQATEGCSWNRCTFCSFYMDRPFAVKAAGPFAAHVDGVVGFLGSGIASRRGVFFADGNALAVGLERLEPLVEAVRERLPGEPLYGFVDLFSGERRPVDHWRRLAELGLERVYIGMETGDDDLLSFVNKPGSQEELVRFVAELKRARLAVCLITMVGLGGWENAARHRESTLAAIARMRLSDGDLVYVSPLIERPGESYAVARSERGWRPLSASEMDEEVRRWRTLLRRGAVKSSLYDIREFVY